MYVAFVIDVYARRIVRDGESEAVELAIPTWVSWFDHHRLMQPLGYVPPAEYEAKYYRQGNAQVALQQ